MYFSFIVEFVSDLLGIVFYEFVMFCCQNFIWCQRLIVGLCFRFLS